MKNLSILVLLFSVVVNAQDDKKQAFLKEFSEKACNCIDSINVHNRPKQEVIEEMSSCIDKQVVAYQLTKKLSEIKFDKPELVKNDAGGKQEVNINIFTDKNSQEYKDNYYEIERYLMANCEPMEENINSNEKQSEKSVSKNKEALRYYELGLVESKEQNYEKAIEYYKEALRIDPDFAFAWDNIGINYRRLEKYDKAIEAYEKSLELDPYGLMPLQNIAIVYVYKKEYDKAIAAYEKLGKVHPGNPEVYYGIAHIYSDYLKKYDLALDYACKAYLIYVETRSPYRVDAEHMISIIFEQMKKENQLDVFLRILEKHNINMKD